MQPEIEAMPTYDYTCGACGHAFEQFQPITAGALRKCPACGALSLKRLIGTGAGILFRGSGFYTTDYRSESYKSAARKEANESGAGKAAAKPAPCDSGACSAAKECPAAKDAKKKAS